MLTETVDRRTGHIRASGRLTALGADLLRGTAQSLHGSGHARVVLDLRDVLDADDAGLDVLRGLGEELAASGGELVVRHAPSARRSAPGQRRAVTSEVPEAPTVSTTKPRLASRSAIAAFID